MRRINTHTLLMAALCLALPLHAQNPGTTGEPLTARGVYLDKTVSQQPDENGKYWITLDAYVTGTTVQTITHKPCDIVLVLDVSGSMDETASTDATYTPRPSQGYTYNSYGNYTYYYLYNGKYYPVVREQYNQVNEYNLYYTTGGWSSQTVYLNGTTTSSTRPTGYESESDPIWQSKLYTRRWSGGIFSGEYVYTETSKSSFSYADLTDDYYIKVGDDYRQVRRSATLVSSNYGLYFVDDNKVRHYLSGTDVTETQPTNVTGNQQTIWTGVLYVSSSGTASKISLLKNAVTSFVNTVQADAETYEVDHRIAVVKFAGNKTSDVGNSTYDGWRDTYNYSQIVNNLSSNFDQVRSNVNELRTGGATQADYGMQHAQSIINGIPSTRESDKVVIMFTDGTPTSSSDFEASVANDAVTAAKSLKGSGVKVFTIGIFDDETNNIRNYMNAVSSNYPGAEAYNNLGTQAADSYYQRSNGADLSSIFTAIAENIGGADNTLGTSSMVVIDVMSANFRLPNDVANKKSLVQTYTVDCVGVTTNADNTKSYSFAKDDEGNEVRVAFTPVIDVTKDSDGNDKVMISNFDFAANFCGLHENSSGQLIAGGKKLVITFPIETSPENPGGATLYTNTPESGIYAPNESGDIQPVATFVQPILTLPNIIIRAYGLQHIGESATYTVYRIKTTPISDGEGGFSYDTYNDNVIDTDYQPITVVLTKTHKKSEPMAQIKLNEEGRYMVVESSWTEGYTPEAKATYGQNSDTRQGGQNTTKVYGTTQLVRTVCLGTESNTAMDEEHPGRGIGTLFDFTHGVKGLNTARFDESAVINTFKAGNNVKRVRAYDRNSKGDDLIEEPIEDDDEDGVDDIGEITE